MKPRDIFSIILKTAGLIIFFYGLQSLIEGLVVQLSLRGDTHFPPKYWNFWGVVQIVFGLFLMRNDTALLNFAYPPSPENPDEDPSKKVEPNLKTQPEPEPATGIRCVACNAVIPEASKVCPKCGWTQPG